MKTLITILALVLGSTGIYFSTSEDHRNCSCSGTFCSCSVSCLDEGEIPGCTCGVFSCICRCDPKDGTVSNDLILPTIDDNQNKNSENAEKYFRSVNYPQGVLIANNIKALREAIKNGNVQSYRSNSTAVESTYSNLSTAQKSAYESWGTQNLKR